MLDTIISKLSAEEAEELKSTLETLSSQRDAARREAEQRRHALKGTKAHEERLAKLEAGLRDVLGVADDDEFDPLEAIPKLAQTKGAGDQAKQLDIQNRRLQRELAEREQAAQQAMAKYTEFRVAAELGKALGSYQWIDKEVVEQAVRAKVRIEDDQLYYSGPEGLLPLEEGIKAFAESKPALISGQAGSGSGFSRGKAQAGGYSKPNPFSKEHFNLTEQGRIFQTNPALAQQLKEAAS